MSDLGNKKVFAKNLELYMKLNQKTRNDLANDLEIPYTTICSWLKAEYYPRIDKIEQLANYFNIQKSDLVETKKIENKKNIDISDLTDEQFETIRQQVEYFRWKNKEKK